MTTQQIQDNHKFTTLINLWLSQIKFLIFCVLCGLNND